MWVKFTPTLEKHFLYILDKILNHDNQRSAPANSGKSNTSFSHSHTDHPSLDFYSQELEVQLNVMLAMPQHTRDI